MGLFSFGRKKLVAAAAVQQQRAAVEQTMYGGGGGEMNDLGPVALILDNNRLTYHNGHWSAGMCALSLLPSHHLYAYFVCPTISSYI